MDRGCLEALHCSQVSSCINIQDRIWSQSRGRQSPGPGSLLLKILRQKTTSKTKTIKFKGGNGNRR